jgi:DNA-binding CsgD family transcriptional regulator/tetratricopeptide (TPR) repeat protein
MPSRLIGRTDHQARIDKLLGAARIGSGGSLLLTGEAGMGKSALLAYATSNAPRFQVQRISGVEFEQELPYSALHQLCVPLMSHLDQLPERHRDALLVAFGMAAGDTDASRVGVAVLGLLTAATRRRPLLLVIDDAQWLDTASSAALVFLSRRISADRIAMLVALRTPAADDSLAGLPALTVTGLADDDARALLAARSPLPLDEQVRDRLLAEAVGNPLALLELPTAGGFLPPGAGVEHVYETRLSGLTRGARLLLTLASADPTGDPALLRDAAARLGLDLGETGAEASSTGLVDFGTPVRFCHPLARSAAYRSAAPDDRRAAHDALAAVTTAADRRAWHRAQARVAPDEEVAEELERCADDARTRGGAAAAAAFLQRAVTLSADPLRRAERTVAAARACFEAGSGERALALLASVETARFGAAQRARADLVRGQITFAQRQDSAGPLLLVRAARHLSELDPAGARDHLLEAAGMSFVAGCSTNVHAQILAAASSTAPAGAGPDLLDALIAFASRGYLAAAPALRAALYDSPQPIWTQSPALAPMVAIELWDTDTFSTIVGHLVEEGRRTGSPLLLRLGLAMSTIDAITTGDPGRAIATTAEEAAVADAINVAPLLNNRMLLAAIRGRRDQYAALLAHTGPDARQSFEQLWPTALLHNGLGDHAAALSAARTALTGDDLFLFGLILTELVEAAARCGDHPTAAEALRLLTERTQASPTPLGLGMAAYCRGLVTGQEEHFREAIELLAPGDRVFYLGRAHLLYGEWLQEQGGRECRDHLRTAHGLLSRSGADGFAQRAATALQAAGGRITPRPASPVEQLTMQEVAVARLVAAGATSSEAAAQLYISRRTVETHLNTIYRKLGLTSRRQLRDHPDLR